MLLKSLTALTAFIALALVGLQVGAGISPAFIYYGPGVATGMGAKLLCSAEYVMGSDRAQAMADVTQYSPLYSALSVEYDDQTQSVTTALLGLKTTTATFIPGLGCAVDFPGHTAREALAVKEVDKSDAPWPAGSLVTTHDRDMQSLVESLVAADNSAGLNTRAMLVVHGGNIVAEVYDQGVTAVTPLLGWSMAKSFTAVMLGNLEMRGLIDLSGTPGFPGWNADPRAAIHITDLLHMADGLDFSEEYNPGDDATTMLFTEPSAAAYVMAKPAAYPPGTTFNYSSGTANLLAALYQETLGSPQAAYDDLMANVWQPMGFQNAVFEMDASGTFVGSSYLYASGRDWARLGQMMLSGGVINDQRIVTEAWIQRATTPNDTANDRAYGYQWWLNDGNASLRFPDLPADAYFANGNRQQTVMVIPSRDTVIVRLGWTAGSYPVNDNFRQILDAL